MNIFSITIHESEDLIVLDKPAGLLSIPDREGKELSLKKMLQGKFGQIYTVHRLDKETSGLIVFAKNEVSHKHLSLEFENRNTKKIYRGLVLGSLMNKSGTMNAPIAEHPAKSGTMMVNRKGKEAITDYEVLQDFGIYSFLQFQIHTGRTHQIRVHMKELGHPILCDKLYGDGKPLLVSSLKSKYKLSKNVEEEKPLLGRLALHAFQLGFKNSKGAYEIFEAPLHKDMRAVLQQLSKRKK
jgi:23S rRNA pseudouridine1911/1915/1917 synthase